MARPGPLPTFVALWVVLTGGGILSMARYASTPGPADAPPSKWPSDTSLTLAAGGEKTVLVFLHPLCSCSDATLAEAEELVAWGHKRLQLVVVVPLPERSSPESRNKWIQSDRVRRASAIPGARVVLDPGGVESHRFHALTSGFVTAYSGDGILRFAGGITAARGQTGESAGLGALENAIDGRPLTTADRFPVFGCLFRELAQGVR